MGTKKSKPINAELGRFMSSFCHVVQLGPQPTYVDHDNSIVSNLVQGIN